MKKYKLIKEYPGSPKLNSIINTENHCVDIIHPEKYPDIWEEIIGKDYEILSFRQKSCSVLIELHPNGLYCYKQSSHYRGIGEVSEEYLLKSGGGIF